MNKRHAQWGHWSITFWERENMRGDWDTYLPGRKVAEVFFPVSTRGPCDLPRRDEYRAMIRAWIDNGVAPAAA